MQEYNIIYSNISTSSLFAAIDTTTVFVNKLIHKYYL